jgi:hypothetical protein
LGSYPNAAVALKSNYARVYGVFHRGNQTSVGHLVWLCKNSFGRLPLSFSSSFQLEISFIAPFFYLIQIPLNSSNISQAGPKSIQKLKPKFNTNFALEKPKKKTRDESKSNKSTKTRYSRTARSTDTE